MKIYLDLVMILNFAIDFILLITVSIILKRNIKITRIMLGAFIGGISILFLFFNLNSILLFVFKIIISVLMILTTFGYKTLKYTLVNLLYLYMSSIILGGFLYLLNLELSYKHIGIIFFNNGLSINFIFLIIFSPFILYIYIKQTKNLRYNYSNYYNIEIINKNKKYKYTAYMDSGNVLVDSLTKKIVILIDKRKLLFNIKEFRLIPYMGVNGSNMIKVVKIDKLIFNNKEYSNILLGVIDKISLDGVDVILNRKLLEG
ncbi:MAG: sigma-E processing peptidase SpoIIGA [Bacilli bacterium]|nr:sigma-E processing peptidase SpoIIGA [Bacilli bacterium]